MAQESNQFLTKQYIDEFVRRLTIRFAFCLGVMVVVVSIILVGN